MKAAAMTRRHALKLLGGALSGLAYARSWGADPTPPGKNPRTGFGPFTGSRVSLGAYRCPDWFRDAKFGIWAHWGPQSAPEDGDW
ncbi:MAG TPA: alpha-L-fucosidase, partial [Verrucomicrobiae bacterium]|nr:alpha-L-fucosidase [Verrucomicrobiae bacterium]